MVDKAQAVNDLRWLAQRLAGIVALLPDLEKIDSTEKALGQAQKEHGIAKVALIDINAAVEKAKAEHVSVQVAIRELKAEAQAKAQAIVDAAKVQAADVVARAKADAGAVASEAAKQVFNAQAAVQDTLAKHASLANAVADLATAKDNLTSDIAAIKAKL